MTTHDLEPVVFRFSDNTAAWIFANGVDMEDVVAGLIAPHFKQPVPEHFGIGRFTHYVRVHGSPYKIITAPDRIAQDGGQVVIAVVPLALEGGSYQRA